MAIDLTDAFTIGGLDPGRGNGVKILMMSGELVGLDGNGIYSIDADGTVTESGSGEAADLSLTHGAGKITVTNYDANGTGTGVEGAVAEIEFAFGSAALTVANGGIEIIGAVANGGLHIDNTSPVAAVGSAVVDHLCPVSLQSISGNAVKFAIGAPYENEGGAQVSISAATILKFTVIAFAKGGVTGN